MILIKYILHSDSLDQEKDIILEYTEDLLLSVLDDIKNEEEIKE